MKISLGQDDKPLYISVSSRGNRRANIEVEQIDGTIGSDGERRNYNVLAYATLNELLDLKDEINNVIQELIA